MLDFDARNVYSITLTSAYNSFSKGLVEESKNNLKGAKGYYCVARGKYSDCFILAEMYSDSRCMKESKEKMDDCDHVLDRLSLKERNEKTRTNKALNG